MKAVPTNPIILRFLVAIPSASLAATLFCGHCNSEVDLIEFAWVDSGGWLVGGQSRRTINNKLTH